MTTFRQSFLGTGAALLVVGLLLIGGAVAAQEYYPVRDINADARIDTLDIQQVASSWNSSGSPRGTLHVFATNATTTGTATNARAGLGVLCRDVDPDAHFCTLQEISTAMLQTGVVFQTPLPVAWVDNIRRTSATLASGGTTYQTTDDIWKGIDSQTGNWFYVQNCNGWSSASGYGTIIEANAAGFSQATCDQAHPVVCCK